MISAINAGFSSFIAYFRNIGTPILYSFFSGCGVAIERSFWRGERKVR
jgi:hypothetical protein